MEGRLTRMTIGAPKTRVAHEMGPAGHRATEEGTYYLMGLPTVGVPTLRQIEKKLEKEMENYDISASPVPGNADGGTEEDVQGFGGYNGSMLRRSANPDTLRRYRTEHPEALEAYLEAWSEIRRERIEREARSRRELGAVRRLIEDHRWRGDE